MAEGKSHDGRLMSKISGCSNRAKESVLFLEMVRSRLGCFQGKATHSYRQQPKVTPAYSRQQKQQKRPASLWVCFVKKVGLLNCGSSSRVQALHSDWLKYDSQSYALNFEKDTFLEVDNQYISKVIGQMPTISGPGARDIITMLLRRSSSANKNCGSHLIPKPVSKLNKDQKSRPLWKRRTGQDPPHLDIKSRHQTFKEM